MKKLLSFVASAGFGLWLATLFVVGVNVTTDSGSNFFGVLLDQSWKFFIIFGVILGLLNYFVKPILNTITLPLRIITLGLFGFIINMGLILLVNGIFAELTITGLIPLAWTTLIIWGLNLLLSKLVLKQDE